MPQSVASSSAEVRSGDFSDATVIPPEKKQKFNEEDDCKITFTGDEDGTSGDDGYESEGYRYPPKKMDRVILAKYLKQVEESEGFEIKDFPAACMVITVFPMPFFLDKPENVVLLKDYAGRALKIYNKKHSTEWEVDNILKVNGGGCRNFIFYVTFSVKTSKGGKDIFQAMIEEDSKVEQGLEYKLEFPIIRPQPKKYSGLYAVV